MKSSPFRFLLRLAGGIAVLVALLAAGLAWYVERPLALAKSPLEFTLAPGTPMSRAARELHDAGVPVHPLILTALARLTGRERDIKAGSYEIRAGLSARELLAKLTRGDTTQAEIALIEGWTFRQVRAALDRHPDLRHDAAGLDDAALLAALGADAKHPEGMFFPDTYLFAKGGSDLDVLRRAHRRLAATLEREWAARAPGLPYRRPYEALIMASIVEKETGRASDRPLIASVFVNRLRAGMPLQTDPTVIYGLGDAFDGNLRKRDLVADTPYNTYTRPGLPPTPIAMPGRAALRASLAPPATDYLYFVSRGDGSSEFSRTLDEHNRAVAQYILRRRTP